MSYIVYRDLFGLDDNDPIVEQIDALDDEIIRRYQEGYVKDEFGSNFTLETAEEYCKEQGYSTAWPSPNSFDALIILHFMMEERNKAIEKGNQGSNS